MDKLASASFGKVLAGVVVVGIGVQFLQGYDPGLAMTFVLLVLVSIMVVNPDTVANFSQRLSELRSMLFGG